jgi:hypothetical protein
MKIAIPVSAHDKHLLPDLTECLLKLGGLEEHPVIFFPTSAAKDTAYEHAERLGAETYPLTQDFEGGAPVACNRHFASVVFALAKMGNTDPFLWMELDMLPVKPRWAVALFEDYRYGGTPFRGVLVNTPFNVNGQIAYKDGDQMMMGTGIYPANMEKDERIKPLLLDLAKPYTMNPREPFDVYLRWPIRNIGVSHTELISDMWSTQNYHMEGTNLVCESVDHGSRVVRPRGGVVSPKAVLVHGCKDGSLADIVLGRGEKARTLGSGWSVETTTVEVDVESFRQAAENVVEAATNPAQDDAFWGDDEKPTEVIPVKAPEPPAHTVTKAPVVTVTELPEEVKIKTPEVKPVKKITRADIEAALGGKKMRVNDLAEKLEVDVAYLIGTFSINGYAVAKAGWVQNTIPITEA